MHNTIVKSAWNHSWTAALAQYTTCHGWKLTVSQCCHFHFHSHSHTLLQVRSNGGLLQQAEKLHALLVSPRRSPHGQEIHRCRTATLDKVSPELYCQKPQEVLVDLGSPVSQLVCRNKKKKKRINVITALSCRLPVLAGESNVAGAVVLRVPRCSAFLSR